MAVASVGGTRHQNAYEFRADWRSTEAQRCHPTLRIRYCSGGEGLPRTLVLFVHGVAVADPVLYFERLRVGISPLDADCIDILFLVESDHHPLRMKRVIFSGEFLCQIGIAFPVGIEIAIVEPREAVKLGATVAGESAVTKLIAVGVANHLLRRCRIAGEISFPRGVAPCALGIPVPGLDKQICVLPITDHSPTCRLVLLALVRPEEHICSVAGHAVYCGTQSVKGTESVHDMAGCRIHLHSLSCDPRAKHAEGKQQLVY